MGLMSSYLCSTQDGLGSFEGVAGHDEQAGDTRRRIYNRMGATAGQRGGGVWTLGVKVVKKD
jgi:hypothetical protein